MSDPKFQLTPPFSGWRTGYQPAPIRLVPDLTLNPTFGANLPGWSVLTLDGRVLNLSPTLPDDDDHGLFKGCGALANALKSPGLDPQAAAPSFVSALGPNAWDKLYGLLREGGPSLWPDIPSWRRNIVTGRPASEGKIDPSGLALPTSPTGVIAGFGLPSRAISLGKRFGFSTDWDVHLYLYLDKDVICSADAVFRFRRRARFRREDQRRGYAETTNRGRTGSVWGWGGVYSAAARPGLRADADAVRRASYVQMAPAGGST
jgi:hypothetical protein